MGPSPPTLPPTPEPAPVPQGASGAVVVGGLSGSAVLLYVIDRLFQADGQFAAQVLTKTGPILGSLWANGPVVITIAAVAWAASSRWRDAQTRTAAEAVAQRASTDRVSLSVGEVTHGLAGLKTEVHELRRAIADHAAAVDARFSSSADELRSYVRAETSALAARVVALETRRRRPPA